MVDGITLGVELVESVDMGFIILGIFTAVAMTAKIERERIDLSILLSRYEKMLERLLRELEASIHIIEES